MAWGSPNEEYYITTNNNVMVDLGLQYLTIQELYEWIVKYDDFGNMNFIKGWESIKADPSLNEEKKIEEAMNLILGSNLSTKQIPRPGLFSGIEIKDYEVGGFVRQTKEDRSRSPVTHEGVVFSNNILNNWKSDAITGYDAEDLELDEYKAAYRRNKSTPENQEGDGKKIDYDNKAITRIIGLNEIINKGKNVVLGLNNEDAKRKFTNDIKRAGGVTWTHLITVILPDTNVECEIYVDWVLVLGERVNLSSSKAKPALMTTTFGSKKSNEVGINYAGRDESDDRLVANLSADDITAADLRVHYNELTDQYEAGTTQILAVMTTNLKPATPPDGDDGMLQDPLVYRNPETGFKVTHGKAMPLTMKGKNLTVWSPEWKYPLGGCDTSSGEDCELLTVPVQNKLLNNFNKGDVVILNRIGGVWQPSASSSGVIADDPVTVNVGKWSFMSMMTNAEHYFWANENNSRILYDQYERAIYEKYYDIFSPELDPKTKHHPQGYIQVSSFDMMGPEVGGNRASHALGQINVDVKNDGVPYSEANTNLNPFETTPFFGVYFPDGYAPGDKFQTYTTPLPDTLEFTARGERGLLDVGYMQSIPTGTTIFSASDGSNVDGSPFATVALSDTTFRQLPADIALNAHPGSENGAPLTIVKTMHTMFNEPDPGLPMQQAIEINMSNRNKRYAWLSNKDDENDPTFDFNPINKTRIVFRPLKSEVYSVFERIAGLPAANNDDIRGNWSTQIYNKVPDGEPALSEAVLDRVIDGKQFGSRGIWDYEVGLKHQKDIAGHPNRAFDSSAYPFGFYTNTWCEEQLPADDGPSSAFGVIGAQCTVTANTAISFNTANMFGMQDWIDPAATTVVNQNFVNLSIGGKYFSSFGGDSSTYYSRNNTTLHARIFHQHPRELTVYDPRFFSVFHFAEGIGEDISIQYMVGRDEMEYPDPNSPQKLIEQVWGDLPNAAFYDPNPNTNPAPGDPPPGKWKFDILEYASTDFREPTLIGSTLISVTGELAPLDFEVYKNDSDPSDLNAVPTGKDPAEWREFDHWQVNSGSRGKLLPYTSERRTVGVGYFDDNGQRLLATGIVIEAQGQKYSEDDRFKTKGGSGKGVLLKPIVDQTSGGIQGFAIVDDGEIPLGPLDNSHGYDFEPKDFFSEREIRDNLDNYNDAEVKIIEDNVNSGGTDLKAYVQRGQIVTKTGQTIPKPEEVNQLLVNLTPKPPNPHTQGQIRNAAPVESTNEITVQISNPSENKQYDVFLHYHNDISHVFHTKTYGSALVTCQEQFVDLTVTPA